MGRSTTKPQTEVNLGLLQEEYLKERARKAYQNLFAELLPYARSLVLKKTTGKVYLPPDLVDSYALDATVKFMAQYENPNFKVDLSFAGLLNLKVLESMYGPKVIAADQIGSLNEHIEGSHQNAGIPTEIGDLAETYGFTYMFQSDSAQVQSDPANYLFDKDQDAINSVLTVIHDLYMSTNLHHFFLVCTGLLQFLKKKKTYEKYREVFLNRETRDILDFTIMEIYNRLKNVA